MHAVKSVVIVGLILGLGAVAVVVGSGILPLRDEVEPPWLELSDPSNLVDGQAQADVVEEDLLSTPSSVAREVILGQGDDPPRGKMSKPDQGSIIGPDEWEQQYQDATVGQILDERRALQALIKAEVDPFFEQAWHDGRYEVVESAISERGGIRFDGDPDVICRFRVDTRNNLVQRVVLPKDGYEKVYSLYEQANWLLAKEQEINRANQIRMLNESAKR